ncbi:hypothetical protein CERSUDRAFT_95381 [Gelatoporia subvermispora B]|uniref:Uncharacterized protein n=1 Tax=Ceriporiopsis subvermispora (strain B) TaxID=914234 RepID=M2RE66_CERS8|nr:hypothetical protein CERSUDRAFT_95381 [Gelatoporia subvermispora B]
MQWDSSSRRGVFVVEGQIADSWPQTQDDLSHTAGRSAGRAARQATPSLRVYVTGPSRRFDAIETRRSPEADALEAALLRLHCAVYADSGRDLRLTDLLPLLRSLVLCCRQLPRADCTRPERFMDPATAPSQSSTSAIDIRPPL